MSLPSIATILRERGTSSSDLSEDERESVLVEAMRRDLAPALKLLHQKSHEAEKHGFAEWTEDPTSDIGKMLIRIHAGDVLRKLASKHFCHGEELTFFNCCKGIVGKPPAYAQQVLLQMYAQDGTHAHADC